jgi:hypothetical protein
MLLNLQEPSVQKITPTEQTTPLAFPPSGGEAQTPKKNLIRVSGLLNQGETRRRQRHVVGVVDAELAHGAAKLAHQSKCQILATNK